MERINVTIRNICNKLRHIMHESNAMLFHLIAIIGLKFQCQGYRDAVTQFERTPDQMPNAHGIVPDMRL